MFRISAILIFTYFQFGCGEYFSRVIDLEDILSENFMPGTLLMLENPENGVLALNESKKELQPDESEADGSLLKAMGTMSFHRSMMNQYLCRSYVADEIIADMSVPRIKRRMGHVTPGIGENMHKSLKNQVTVENSLMNDEGSSGYKDWLSKSTTLEDIYRHYERPKDKIDADLKREDENNEEFDEDYNAEVTGYPEHMNEPQTQQMPMKHRGPSEEEIYYSAGDYPPQDTHYQHSDGGNDFQSIVGGGGGYSHGGYPHGGDSGYNGGGGYAVHEPAGGHYGHDNSHDVHEQEYEYHIHPPQYHGYEEVIYKPKEKDLADLFEIALTALAFLSFGMFIIHIIMCISAVTNNNSTTTVAMMMPMSMSPTATGTGAGTTSTGTGGGSMTGNGGGGATGTGDGATSTGGGTTGTGDGTTSTENGGSNAEDGSTGTGGGTTSTGGGSTGMDNGDTATGNGDNGGGGTETGGGSTGSGITGGGSTETGTGDTAGGSSPDTGTGDGGTGSGGTTGGTAADGSPTGGETGAADNGGTGTGGGTDSFKFRLRRDIPTITNPDTYGLNELARKVLISMESALVANDDNGECLRKSLCDNNKWSRTLEGRNRIVIPFWSLGMSWLSGRLVDNIPPATSMLDTLKASILGLGNANCEIIYQKCDLRRQMGDSKKRRKRRKRNT